MIFRIGRPWILVAVAAFVICTLQTAIGRASAENHIRNGTVYFEQGDFKNALAEYDKAIGHDPKNAEAYRARARVRLMAEQEDLAIADADKAIALDAKFAPAYEMRAYALCARKDYASAIADIEEAIALEPENLLWYIVRGEIYGEQGNHKQFQADLDKGMEDPKATEKLKEIDSFGRGIVHYVKDAADAIAHYTHILEVNPQAEMALYQRGRLYAEQEEFEKALADFTELISLRPDNPYYYEQRALCYHCFGREEEAEADMESVKEFRKNNG